MSRPRFAADEMLGSLAKWLRILGYDTTYEKDKKDDEILKLAIEEGRVLLTRDKGLARSAEDNALYIESDDIDEQLRQVVSRYRLVFNEGFTRCASCGGDLMRVSREEASKEVPARSLAMTDEFFRCVSCGQYYWKGTHWKSMTERIDSLGIPHERSLE
ncbi:MAG: Mut7-C RNAse domain-containing protein [Methanomassiliicoccales archaeon]|nr:MAG: Mut7-C RNAse domain-containing protein [Methanomassiliicoccales archaeon]